MKASAGESQAAQRALEAGSHVDLIWRMPGRGGEDFAGERYDRLALAVLPEH
jgi:hypothetical protein